MQTNKCVDTEHKLFASICLFICTEILLCMKKHKNGGVGWGLGVFLPSFFRKSLQVKNRGSMKKKLHQNTAKNLNKCISFTDTVSYCKKMQMVVC